MGRADSGLALLVGPARSPRTGGCTTASTTSDPERSILTGAWDLALPVDANRDPTCLPRHDLTLDSLGDSPTDMDKVAFMQELVDVRELHAGPWAIMGDFNLLVSPQDKNNDVINRRMIARFRNKANQLEVKEMYLNGRKFTWSNERQRPTMEKIDHVFTTNCWDDAYPAALLTAMGSAVSDHCPLLLDINAYFAYGKRFRFDSEGNAFIVLDNKLRATAKALQWWSDRWIGNIWLQIAIALEVITRLDGAMDSRILTDQERGLRNALKKKLLGLCSLQRTIARQRSRLLQLKEGEANTAFFHRQASHRQRKNAILSIVSEDQVHTGQENIAHAVDAYYARLLGSTTERA
ncbi:uncharacterized protein [Aegilops tauschii subsp. strangulata]|uniref:uncharacterized protein n=1 Tax=Aegilops tauschii subsp. strangulata TaxID=200361 RepID=UPI003CC841B1